ncbi:MAG: site-specific integrase, partial [Planctomycetes bacterium]|nr:site-specific integrase [Planctomycetota bacterium]
MDHSSPIVQHFLNYLRFERRFSEHTAKCYGADLGQYVHFLTSPKNEQAAEPVSVSGVHGSPVTATAVQVQQEVDVNHLLVHADVDV